jgi:hypothetical protein
MKRSIVLTEYWIGASQPYHCTYSSMLRDGETDVDLGQLGPEVLRELVAESGAVDGDEVEIVVRRTGRRPFGDRRVRLVRAHTYEREEEKS